MKGPVAGAMIKLGQTMPADAHQAWDILTDLEAWPLWGPSVRRAELIDGDELALGVRGRVWTPIGLALPFTVTEFVPGRCWRWEVANIAATRHEVQPLPHGCRVVFGVPWWAPAYLPVCAVALHRIVGVLGGR
jgi:polyketide cyclase/dehydrase/lipid transport protein